jgi:hypothetical protein
VTLCRAFHAVACHIGMDTVQLQGGYQLPNHIRHTPNNPRKGGGGEKRQWVGYLVALESAVRLLGIEDLTTRSSRGYTAHNFQTPVPHVAKGPHSFALERWDGIV